MHILPACIGYALLRVGTARADVEPDACSLLQSVAHGGHFDAVAPWPPAAPKPVAVAPGKDDNGPHDHNEWKSYLTDVADIFLALDSDKNKLVSVLEFAKVFKEDVWRDAIVLGRLVDKDGDEQIAIDEFKNWLTKVPDASEEQRKPMLSDVVLVKYLRNLANVFFMLDTNMDKSLTLEELTTLFNEALWRQATVGVLLDLIDGNGDNALDFIEFRSWFVGAGVSKEAAATPSEADITYSPVQPSETPAPGTNSSAEAAATPSEADISYSSVQPSETAAPGANSSAAAEGSWEEEADEWDKTMSSRAEAATQKDMTWDEEEQAWNDRMRRYKEDDAKVDGESTDTETWDNEAEEWGEITKAQKDIDGNAEAAKAQSAEAQSAEAQSAEAQGADTQGAVAREDEEPELEEDSVSDDSEGRMGRRTKNRKQGTNEGNGTGVGSLDDQEEDAENCADKEPTGFKVNGWAVPCMALARECENPIFSEALQIACPMTCGRCFQLKVEAAAKKTKEFARAREERESARKQAAAVAEAKAIADSLAKSEDAAVDNLKKKLDEEEAARAADEERQSVECKDVDDEHTGFSTEVGGPVGCKDLAKYCDEASFSVQIQSACPATCQLCTEAKHAKVDKRRRR